MAPPSKAAGYPPERRLHPRAPVPGTVGLFSHLRFLGRFDLLDLSAGGTRLAGAPELVPGAQVTVLLELPRRRPVRIEARVSRVEPHAGGGRNVILAFTRLPAGAEDAIQEMVLRYLTAA